MPQNLSQIRKVQALLWVMAQNKSFRTSALERYLKSTIDPDDPETQEEARGLTRRSIQRDLKWIVEQGDAFPFGKLEVIGTEAGENEYLWSRKSTARSPLTLDPEPAFAFCLAQQIVEKVLPERFLKSIEPSFQQARKSLPTKGESPYNSRLLERIDIRTNAFSLPPPSYQKRDLLHILEAISHRYQMQVEYASPWNPERQQKKYTLNPLGLIERNGFYYLAAEDTGVRDERGNLKVKTFHLSRFKAISVNPDTTFTYPSGFDIRRFSIAHDFSEQMLRVKARFSRKVAAHLFEAKIPDHCKTMEADQESFILEFEAPDNSDFKRWITSYGSGVEVLEPPYLRRILKEDFRKAASFYAEENDDEFRVDQAS